MDGGLIPPDHLYSARGVELNSTIANGRKIMMANVFKVGDIVHLRTPGSHMSRPMVVRGPGGDPNDRPSIRKQLVSCNWLDASGVPQSETYDPAQLALNQDQGL